MQPLWSQLGLHVIAKPIGPICNIQCRYCFYLEKENLYPKAEQWKMSDETLERYVRQYIEAQSDLVDEIDFAFQGGEPTLMGLDFFRKVLALQRKYASPGKRIHNSLQTNGISLDDTWCQFLKENRFLVGLSMDGPADLHDRYRVDRKGQGTHAAVMEALQRLRRHGVDFNVLCCVNRHNADQPLRVYRFFREQGVEFVQFIPIVEPLREAIGAASADVRPETLASERSVRPKQFGQFLIACYDEWVRNDVGRVFVRDFDQALAVWVGAGPTLCVYSKQCGRATAIEHNGDLYSCDHFVDPAHKLGNVHQTPIREMANSPFQEKFGRDKFDTLPQYCRHCDTLTACYGACPKDRFLHAPDGEPGLNYLCEGFKMFFRHIDPTMAVMAEELRAGRPAMGVMRRLRAARQQALASPGAASPRNAPCPCGSGRKFKNCCLRGENSP